MLKLLARGKVKEVRCAGERLRRYDNPKNKGPKSRQQDNVGALIIRIGFSGILYHNSSKEPPQR